MKSKLAIVSLLLGVCVSLWANDTLSTLAAGGLVPIKSTDIVLQSEELDISLPQVRVRYTFHNQSDHDIEPTVAFPLPEVDGADLFHVPTLIPFSDPANFVNFKVEQLWAAPGSGNAAWDRKPISTEIELRAFHQDKDITETLRRLGLPLSVLDSRMDTSISALKPETKKEVLLKDEIIGFDETAGADGKTRRLYYPGWSNRIQFYWKQRFPANAITVLEQTYMPVVGGGYIVKTQDPAIRGETADLGPFCIQPHQQQSIAELLSGMPEDGSAGLLEREIKYILTTANHWSGPIREFRLTIHTDSPRDVVLTCMTGFTQSSPTEYRLTHTNSRPSSELDVMIVQRIEKNR